MTSEMNRMMDHFKNYQAGAKGSSSFSNSSAAIGSLVDCAQNVDDVNHFKYITEIDAQLLAVQVLQINHLQVNPNALVNDADLQRDFELKVQNNWPKLKGDFFTNHEGENGTFPLLTDQNNATNSFISACAKL